ncbi:hypothetical protein Pcinc_002556 [Petrolisthes cinctipes]|uniref:Uncharacterized protein n=1 Tax=Petrolisthes cinctipes TaxID=88211 RepID=A0AAE1GQ37_PETCI|nr:hypothetical protein Pcinc_002556 [Petrolisthes cinctipes]
MVKQSSAFQSRKMIALWLYAVKKRRTLASCCMWPMRQSMTTVIFKFDTYVFVLAVMVAQALPCMDELWIAFGTGKNYRYIPAHEIAASLGP